MAECNMKRAQEQRAAAYFIDISHGQRRWKAMLVKLMFVHALLRQRQMEREP